MTGDGKKPLSPLKKAYLRIQELESRIEAAASREPEPIAIIGAGCRFPGDIDSPAAYWRLLRDGAQAVGEIPAERWDADAYFDPQPNTPGKMFTRAGAFLEQVDLFDPQFFGIAPREATSLDPQQRLLLEIAWEALENAGQAPDKLANSPTGVFVGVVSNDYAQLQIQLDDATLFDAYHASGSAHSMASGRLSYVLGLMGPSMSIDTACSSSLVAVHQACQSLIAGECQMALAGGVNLILSPVNNITFCQSEMLSPEGLCKSFAAGADGFVHGEGCGIVVLKRLADALRDGDRIDAVVRGSAVNQDGPSSGITAPNGPAQEAVISTALEHAGVDPAAVSYVEAHGTATPLGDPIEALALGAVYGRGRPEDQPLRIGSVKTNIGHLSAAAGVAGLIKLVLALKAKQIPPHLHFEEPSPHIPWARLPLEVVTELSPWTTAGEARIAGVSSFGFSGTNVHLIVGEAPETDPRPASPEPPTHLLALAARSEMALRSLAGNYAEFMSSTPDADLADIAFTANAGRAHFNHRLVTGGGDTATIRDALQAYSEGRKCDDLQSGILENPDPPRVAFLFTGQGSQYVGMGRVLYDTQPTFRRALERCDELLRPHMDVPLLELIFGDSDKSLIDQTAYTQPALFAIEYSLARLWRSWGVEPWVVMGHSVGEYVAACVAGAINLEQGLELIARRGRLMQTLPAGGCMAAVFADVECVGNAIESFAAEVSIAAINGPENVVISGACDAVDAVLEALQADGISAHPLPVSHAFHSPLMEPVLDELETAADDLVCSPARIGLVSNLTGDPVGPDELARGAYWRRHAREPVQFEASIRGLYERGIRVFLEIGPSPILLGMASACLPHEDAVWLPSLRKEGDDWSSMQRSLGSLYVHGVDVDWAGYTHDYPYQKLALPTYSFQRKRYWIEGARWGAARSARQPVPRDRLHPLLARRLETALEPFIYEGDLSRESAPELYEHVVHGVPIAPATAILEMATAAGSEQFGMDVTLSDVRIERALFLPTDETLSVQVIVTLAAANRAEFQLFSRANDEAADWTLHAAGAIAPRDPGQDDAVPDPVPLGEIAARCLNEVGIDILYSGLWDRGLHFGPIFRGIEKLQYRDGEALGEVQLPAQYAAAGEPYRIHPALLDACLQVAAAAVPGFSAEDNSSDIYMPIGLDRYQLFAGSGVPRFSYARVENSASGNKETLTAHVELCDVDGRLTARISGLQLKRADAAALVRSTLAAGSDMLYQIDWLPFEGSGERDTARVSDVDLQRIVRRLRDRPTELAAEHGMGVWDAVGPGLDTLCAAYIARALEHLGMAFEPDQRVTTDALLQTLGIESRHRRLMDRYLSILDEEDILTRSGDAWTVRRRPDLPDPASLAARLLAEHKDCEAEIQWTAGCGEGLAAALCGDVDPLQLLFPGGDLEPATRVYSKSPSARTFNALTTEFVQSVLDEMPADRPLRVLEIGGGTGGTSAALLRGLPADRIEYLFTDIGAAFVNQARERFANYPLARFEVLDIEENPIEQGLPLQWADIIVATNVLHATVDLRRTMKHVKELLAPGGLLILNEVTQQQRWFDLTVGLTEGWWSFCDHELRQDHTLLNRSQWMALLEQSGFTDTAVIPEADVEHEPLRWQALITGRIPSSPQRDSETWLIFADERGVGAELADRLTTSGATCIEVHRAGAGAPAVARVIDAASPDEFQGLLDDIRKQHGSSELNVVYLWPLDWRVSDVDPPSGMRASQLGVCAGALHLLQALVSGQVQQRTRLGLVTRGAQAVLPGDPLPGVGQAPIWGLARSLTLEHPELSCLTIDLDPGSGTAAEDADALVSAIRDADAESELALRGGLVHTSRLIRATTPPPVVKAEGAPGQELRRGVYLERSANGLLDDLRLEPMEVGPPGPGQVLLRCLATGMNFHDVLCGLGVLDDMEYLGVECAGRVVALGAGVEHLAVGDEVVAVAPRSYATYVTANADLVVRKPPQLGFAEAATLPVAFLMADHALNSVGHLKSGERVLIHAAAGGVGQAAVQLAKRAGAQIFATAGSQEKRDYLRSLGIDHVMDSRSLDFADQILEVTDGTGVDVVLNSLAGEAIARSLSLLSPGGRFLELGRTDLWNAEQVADINAEATYHVLDLTPELDQASAAMGEKLEEILTLYCEDALEPLPVHTFALQEADRAFRFMAQARHIGKVVLVQDAIAVEGSVREPADLRADASYLVTGGLGGLGLLVAQWMVERGARHLVLMGRSEASPEAMEMLATMEQSGARVVAITGDVSQESDVRDVLAQIERELPPLAGVIHSAGIVDDVLLAQQSWDRFEKVLAPKVRGAWNLHALTHTLPLDFFVMFSSIASVLGGSGSANHSAACAFLDALAHYRRSLELPGLSLSWGAWSAIGAGVRHNVEERFASRGMGVITPDQGLEILARALAGSVSQLIVLPVDWQKFLSQENAGHPRPLLSCLASELQVSRRGTPVDAPDQPAVKSPNLLARLAVTVPSKWRGMLRAEVTACAVKALGLAQTDTVDPRQPLNEMGLDSLMAVELRSALGAMLEKPLPATLIFDYPTIEALSDHLYVGLAPPDEPASGQGSNGAGEFDGEKADDVLSAIEGLSDEDVDRLLDGVTNH